MLSCFQGLALLYPFVGKQLVNIDSDDLLKLAFYDKVKIDTLSEKAQADLTDTGGNSSSNSSQHIVLVDDMVIHNIAYNFSLEK